MNKLSSFDRMIMLSISFTFLLIICRMIFSGTLMFVFIGWNIILAIIPYLLSRSLEARGTLNFRAMIKLLCWLLFLPNAPYILTDLFHLDERPPVPIWFDLMLLSSAALNGLFLAVVSLLQVERFLRQHLRKSFVNIIVAAVMFLCGYGIYLGRFLRYNSWDILSSPVSLINTIIYSVIHPFQHTKTWGFSIVFACLLSLVFYSLKTLSSIGNREYKQA